MSLQSSSAEETLRQVYDDLAHRREIRTDPAQIPVVEALDDLLTRLRGRRISKDGGLFGRILRRRSSPDLVKGLYVYGGVGRGKTMLMDLFFSLAPGKKKKRFHFNDFMMMVHDRIAAHRLDRKEGRTREDDPIPPVARVLAQEAQLLCFDEFTVTDIADAMVLSRLFSALFENGVVLVATSNVAPDNLYTNGLNRQLFVPFIAVLKAHAEILNLDSQTDYRLEKVGQLPVYTYPLGEETRSRMRQAWEALCEGASQPEDIIVKGRKVHVPCACGRSARFDFVDVCLKALGARDYLAIAARFDTVMIENIPVLDDAARNESKRFILLIDTLYDHHARVFVSAAAPVTSLYSGRTGVEAFEFHRTVSRLIEMQGEDWLKQWQIVHGMAEGVD
ncbi:cell division protein ZapE [Limoniibacter endophyticus]|uniref:Cell division protein ZapE n=1 Tax=Limoniibacter endophyticus TaxID=1565040 RepID=A0A8J3DR70_9HYPH|nr:cell division protein ZapE [Limoniibacter endophyticus]GHC74208.1 cell division protein ZapE [Limoniibacter endophyticus]